MTPLTPRGSDPAPEKPGGAAPEAAPAAAAPSRSKSPPPAPKKKSKELGVVPAVATWGSERVPGAQLCKELRSKQQLRLFSGVWRATAEPSEEALKLWLGADDGFHDLYAVALEGNYALWNNLLLSVLKGFKVVGSEKTDHGQLTILAPSQLSGVVSDASTARLDVAGGHAEFCMFKLGVTSFGFIHAQLEGSKEERHRAICELFDDCPAKPSHWTGQQLTLFTNRLFVLGSLNFPLVDCTKEEVEKYIQNGSQESCWERDELLQTFAGIASRQDTGNPGVAVAAKYVKEGLPDAATMLLSFFNERAIKYPPNHDGWAQRVLYKDGGAKGGVDCLSYDSVKGMQGAAIFSQFDVGVDFPLEKPVEPKPVEKKKSGRSKFCSIQ
jgi:hypothetical protein